MIKIIHVTLPGNIFDYLDYAAPSEPLPIGVRVKVSFRGKPVLGLVTGQRKEASLPYRLQPIVEIVDSVPILSEPLIKLMFWLSEYYQCALSEVYSTMLPKLIRQGAPLLLETENYYQLKQAPSEGCQIVRSKKQLACVDFLSNQVKVPSIYACQQVGISKSTLNALIEKNIIECVQQPVLPDSNSGLIASTLNLNEEQQHAYQTIIASLNEFQAFLLFGVTGSGKTEIYFQVMQQILSQQKQVLILVPEIGLTPQFIARVQKRFSEPLALLHSKLNDKERLKNWLWCKENHAKILIGTRSSVFTPLPSLGLIIVDESHDLSFKQQTGLRFSGRDVALKRAFDLQIPIILGSATPSLESFSNAQNKKYILLPLTKRAATQEKCLYRIIDLRIQRIQDGLCDATLARIKAHLDDKQQVLVFINRRGFAPILICHQCGWMADCKHCSAHLTVHAHSQTMQCHHCGFKRTLARQCESCFSLELIPVGAGTERLAESLTRIFPNNKVMRVDRDTTSGKSRLQDALESIDAGEVDILVGTQLLAKGHHFKKLTLVVVVDADAGFYSQDFRALERLGQVITQVAGRAGREVGGEVVIQTHQPDNEHLNVLVQKGYYAFSQALLKERQAFAWPPFSFLALCRAQGKKANQVQTFFMKVKQYLHQCSNQLTILGPAPAPMEKKAGLFQLQLLIRAPARAPLIQALRSLRTMLRDKQNQKLVASLRFTIDVDPQDLS